MGATVEGSRITFNYPFVCVLLVTHVGALGAFWFYSNENVVLFLILLFLNSASLTIGYHRLLSHRSFSVSRPMLRFMALVGVLFLQGRPIQWAVVHRLHHRYSDQTGDPHNARLGFWNAHWLWLFRVDAKLADPEVQARIAPDLVSDPFLRILEKWQINLAAVIGVSGTLFLFGGIGAVIWGVCVRMVVREHLTYLINSVGNSFGHRNHDTKDLSRNNRLVSLFTWGEGWHNNHHASPASANFGRGWKEPDPAYWVICAMKALGLATGNTVG